MTPKEYDQWIKDLRWIKDLTEWVKEEQKMAAEKAIREAVILAEYERQMK